MKHMVSYKLKPERVAENERLAAAVYDALREARPPGLRYATFRLGDGVSFVHIVSHEEADYTSPVVTRVPRLWTLYRGGLHGAKVSRIIYTDRGARA